MPESLTLFSAALLLLLVMDPFGNVPVFMSVLQNVDPDRRRKIIIRELLIALGIMIVFLFGGRYILAAIGISESVLTIAGGILLFLIALRMVFPPPGGAFTADAELGGDEPFIVPLAVPFIAGPSVLASVLFIMSSDPDRWPEWLAAVGLAWIVSGVVLMSAVDLARLLGKRGLVAIERLMGMVLIAIATKMVMSGISQFFSLS